jgi:bifunctional DNA-binding transcriptional regulator/antitoxin component of YhaV-PrlF toxin-antitoxin module
VQDYGILGFKEISMTTVTLSREHELVIPRTICDTAGLKEGASFNVITDNGKLELIPVKPMEELFGIFKGIDTTITREDDRL